MGRAERLIRLAAWLALDRQIPTSGAGREAPSGGCGAVT